MQHTSLFKNVFISSVLGKTGSSRFCFISIFFFLYIIFLSWSSLIQLQVTYGWTKTLLSSQGTEVNKNSTSYMYTSVVSPQNKKKKKKKKKEKKKRKGLGPD